tara:strand:- start:1081 stop:1278 length:198 start_codon:yes stop_codon:yes gene_type:complete
MTAGSPGGKFCIARCATFLQAYELFALQSGQYQMVTKKHSKQQINHPHVKAVGTHLHKFTDAGKL